MALDKIEQGQILKGAGLSTMEVIQFGRAGRQNERVNKLLDSLSGEASIKDDTRKEILSAMGKKWKEDKDLFTKLDKDLANPALEKRIADLAKTNPNSLKTAIAQYNGSNMAQLLPEPEKASPAAPSSASGNKDKEPKGANPAKEGGSKNTPPAGGAVNNKPVKPTVTPSTTEPTQVATPAKQENAPPSTSGANSGVTKPPEDKNANNSFKDDILNAFATGTDEDIKAAIDPEIAKELAMGLADKALEVGVPKANVDGFRERINDPKNPQLLNAITKNLQNNPGFVRELAMLAQNKEKLPDAVKPKVQEEMNKLMANPELLADEKEVQRLERQMRTAREFKSSGFGAMFDGVIGFFKGLFQGLAEQLQRIFAGFTGPNKVLSMSTSGSSIVPAFLMNTRNYDENQRIARLESQYSPSTMTAFAPKVDGKYFHDGAPVMGPDGKQKIDEKTKKPVFEQVPNGQITVKNSEGNDEKVIPSIGSQAAIQAKGEYVNGVYKPGPVRVPVVVAIDENGASSKLKWINMTPEAFADYKQKADAGAKANNHSFKELAFEAYTEKDAQKAGIMPTTTIVSVDRKTGTVSEPVMHDIYDRPDAQKPGLQPNGVQNRPVRLAGQNAANDRDFELQA